MKIKLLTALSVVLLLILSGHNFAQAPPLGTAADFVLFSTVGAVGNTGISQVTGNVGTNSGAITGFGNVNGVMHTSNGATAQCAADLLIAYNQLNSTIPTFFPAPLLGNGQILIAGVYSITGAATLNLNLILDAQNDPDAVFIIQIQGPFSTAANSKVTLINQAQACNVFWKVEGLVDMSSGTTMRGTVIANNAAINMNVGDTLEGRALSTAGAVNVSGVLAYTPVGCGSPVLMGPAAPDLVSAACYAVFSSDGPVTNSGITYVTGDVGTNVGLTTGFNPLFVTGIIHDIPDGSTAAAAADLHNAYIYLNTLPFDIQLLYPAQFGNNLVLTPHTYLLNAATTFTDTLYLNAGGQADAVFVIQINGALSTSTYAKVILINGALAENVYWKVDGAVSINDYSIFNGTIVANNGAVDLTTGVTLNGRAFTTTGALSTTAVTVTMPPGCGSVSAPEIVVGPEDQTVCEDGMVSFTVSATGTGLTYQWRRGTMDLTDGINIFGATTDELTINPAGISDAATDYNVVVTGTYPPAVTSENVSLFVQVLPTNVFAGDDATVCETCPFTLLDATAEDYSSLLWTTTGDGDFDDETDLNATYTPGLTDPGTFVTLCLHVEQIAPCIGLPYVDCMDLYVQTAQLEPVANAGPDQEICENQIANLVGDAQNYSGVMWSGGDGVFSSPNSLITDYTPGTGDILAGTVELCLTAELIVPYTVPDVDCMILTIYSLPTVNAGDDATVCETCPFTLLDATAENYSSLLWTTTGDGDFDDETDLNATYTPGLTDPGTFVTLCLHVEQIAPCDGPPYVDCMDLYVQSAQLEPVADAGADQEICAGQVANLVGDAQNYSGVMWSGGDGVFSSPNSFITDYTPGPGDIFAGTVELCLTAEPIFPNTTVDIDCMMLTISGSSTVNAGADMTVCSDIISSTDPYLVITATASNYNGLEWTGGNGFFDPDDELITNYYPDQADIDAGSVILCLTAGPVLPCLLGATDCMTLYFELSPTANAGSDAAVCAGDAYLLFDAEATNFSSLLWTTSGDGLFDDPTMMNPEYTPGTSDANNGTVILYLTVQPQGIVCLTPAIDDMLLNIVAQPIVDLGPDLNLSCGDFDFATGKWMPVTPNLIIENYSTVNWTTSGDGNFFPSTTSVDAMYNLGVNDIWGGEVILCLTVYGDVSCGSDITDCVTIKIPQQLIPFDMDTWWGVSSYLIPDATSVPGVMAPVVGPGPGSTNLTLMVNKHGRYYWPMTNPPVNQLGNWLPIGYKAKFKNSPCCLPIYGSVLTDQHYTVSGGSDYIPVLTNVKTPIAELFAGHLSDIQLIYDWAPNELWTPSTSDFTDLEPGRAYLLVSKNPNLSYTIEFPDYDLDTFVFADNIPGKEEVNNSPWNDIVNTSQPHFVLFAEYALNELLTGDIIGAFNQDGLCLGLSEYAGRESFFKLIAMGNDPLTDENDGYESGEYMHFNLYRPETGVTCNVDFMYDPSFPNYDGTFAVNGVSNVIKIEMTITATNDLNINSTIKVFPNPARDVINITSDNKINQVNLIDITGQLVIGYNENGNKIQVDVSNYVKGLYFLQIETDDGAIITKRIVIE